MLDARKMTPGRWGMVFGLALFLIAVLASGCMEKADTHSGTPPQTNEAKIGDGGKTGMGPPPAETVSGFDPDIVNNDIDIAAQRQKLTAEKERLEKKRVEAALKAEDLGRQIDAVNEKRGAENGKSELISEYNSLMEKQQPLISEQNRLTDAITDIGNQLTGLDILETTGTDLALAERQRLEKMPEELDESNAPSYGVYPVSINGENAKLRQALWQFYEDTGYGKGTLPVKYSPTNPDTQFETEGATGAVSGRLTSMTIRIGQFTEEGDMILRSVTAWGKGYLILTDQSRDQWKSSDTEDFTVTYARYLNWLTEEESGMEKVVASDRESLTYGQLMESLLSSMMEAQIPHTFLVGFS